MISKDDAARIAGILNVNRGYAPPRIRSHIDKITLDLADAFLRDNHSFDHDRFLIAAGTPRKRDQPDQ